MLVLFGPSMATLNLYTQNPNNPSNITMAANNRTTSITEAPQRRTRNNMSPLEARVSLVLALASQTSSLSQRLLMDLATETAKYVFPKRFESRNLEEALMSVPDLETVKFKVLSRTDQYEIRELEPYFIAETTMPGKSGFDFNGASQSFNVLAEYLFGKNTKKEKMEMTTPVFTRRTQSDGEKMEMTTPVITKKVFRLFQHAFFCCLSCRRFFFLLLYFFCSIVQVRRSHARASTGKHDKHTGSLEDQDKWQMSFVMPSKYGSNLPLPKDPSVSIKEVPRKIVAVVAFSGFVTDEEVKSRESTLRNALKSDSQFQVKEGASVEVAQYNPPFTLPFARRNEIALEVERKEV